MEIISFESIFRESVSNISLISFGEASGEGKGGGGGGEGSEEVDQHRY